MCFVSKKVKVSRACHVPHFAWPATDFTLGTPASSSPFVPFTPAHHFHWLWARGSGWSEQCRGYADTLAFKENVASDRLTTQATTSPLPLPYRRWVKRSDLGMLASPLLSQEREREARTLSEFITQIGKVLTRPFHNFVPVRETRSDMSKKGKSVMLCEGLIEKEKFLSERGDVLNVFEWRADQAVLGKGVAQAKLSEAEYHSWGLLEEQKRSFAVWSAIWAGQARIEGRMRTQSSSWSQYAASFSKKGTSPSESFIWSIPKREELVMHRIGQKSKGSSRRSYDESSRNRRIGKDVLYRSWKSDTIDNTWTFYSRRRK